MNKPLAVRIASSIEATKCTWALPSTCWLEPAKKNHWSLLHCSIHMFTRFLETTCHSINTFELANKISRSDQYNNSLTHTKSLDAYKTHRSKAEHPTCERKNTHTVISTETLQQMIIYLLIQYIYIYIYLFTIYIYIYTLNIIEYIYILIYIYYILAGGWCISVASRLCASAWDDVGNVASGKCASAWEDVGNVASGMCANTQRSITCVCKCQCTLSAHPTPPHPTPSCKIMHVHEMMSVT